MIAPATESIYPSGRVQIVLTRTDEEPSGSRRLDLTSVDDLEHDEDGPIARFSLPFALSDELGVAEFLASVRMHDVWIYQERDGSTRCLWLSNCTSEVATDEDRVRLTVTYRAWRRV